MSQQVETTSSSSAPCVAADVAARVVAVAIMAGRPISNLRMQKLLYALQREHFRRYCKPLFEDDFRAWMTGPAIPSVYRAYSKWGGSPIPTPNAYRWRNVFTGDCEQIRELQPEQAAFVDRAVETWCSRPIWDPKDVACKPGGAWEQTLQHGEGYDRVIPKRLIKKEGENA